MNESQLMKIVCATFNVDISDVMSRRRDVRILDARRMMCLLDKSFLYTLRCSYLERKSIPKMGAQLLKTDSRFKEIYNDIKNGCAKSYTHYFGRVAKGEKYFRVRHAVIEERIDTDSYSNYKDFWAGNYFLNIEKAKDEIKNRRRKIYERRKSKDSRKVYTGWIPSVPMQPR